MDGNAIKKKHTECTFKTRHTDKYPSIVLQITSEFLFVLLLPMSGKGTKERGSLLLDTESTFQAAQIVCIHRFGDVMDRVLAEMDDLTHARIRGGTYTCRKYFLSTIL